MKLKVGSLQNLLLKRWQLIQGTRQVNASAGQAGRLMQRVPANTPACLAQHSVPAGACGQQGSWSAFGGRTRVTWRTPKRTWSEQGKPWCQVYADLVPLHKLWGFPGLVPSSSSISVVKASSITVGTHRLHFPSDALMHCGSRVNTCRSAFGCLKWNVYPLQSMFAEPGHANFYVIPQWLAAGHKVFLCYLQLQFCFVTSAFSPVSNTWPSVMPSAGVLSSSASRSL